MKEARMKEQNFSARINARNLPVPHIHVEWYGNSCWRLPSGKALAEFALQSGFLAPLLFKTDSFSGNGSSLAQSAGPAERSKELKKAGQA